MIEEKNYRIIKLIRKFKKRIEDGETIQYEIAAAYFLLDVLTEDDFKFIKKDYLEGEFNYREEECKNIFLVNSNSIKDTLNLYNLFWVPTDPFNKTSFREYYGFDKFEILELSKENAEKYWDFFLNHNSYTEELKKHFMKKK